MYFIRNDFLFKENTDYHIDKKDIRVILVSTKEKIQLWRHGRLNPGPSACEAGAQPLSFIPIVSNMRFIKLVYNCTYPVNRKPNYKRIKTVFSFVFFTFSDDVNSGVLVHCRKRVFIVNLQPKKYVFNTL